MLWIGKLRCLCHGRRVCISLVKPGVEPGFFLEDTGHSVSMTQPVVRQDIKRKGGTAPSIESHHKVPGFGRVFSYAASFKTGVC